MKKCVSLLLGLVIVVQFYVPASMIMKHERVLRNGELFRFKTEPIDPTDPFQGRYVWLRYAGAYIPGTDEHEAQPDWKQNVFVSLGEDNDGFSAFTRWSIEEPSQGSFLKLQFAGKRTRYHQETKKHIYEGLRFKLPFNRFYMDEAKAPVAETIVREGTRNTNCWANVRVLDGVGLIEDVMVEGISIRELSKQRLSKE